MIKGFDKVVFSCLGFDTPSKPTSSKPCRPLSQQQSWTVPQVRTTLSGQPSLAVETTLTSPCCSSNPDHQTNCNLSTCCLSAGLARLMEHSADVQNENVDSCRRALVPSFAITADTIECRTRQISSTELHHQCVHSLLRAVGLATSQNSMAPPRATKHPSYLHSRTMREGCNLVPGGSQQMTLSFSTVSPLRPGSAGQSVR